ncbi:unnamed protein product, partial [Phaeothamnion confervicola]
DAAVDLDAALELAPGDASIYFQRGWVRKAARDFEGAAEDFEAARRLRPHDITLLVDYTNVMAVEDV